MCFKWESFWFHSHYVMFFVLFFFTNGPTVRCPGVKGAFSTSEKVIDEQINSHPCRPTRALPPWSFPAVRKSGTDGGVRVHFRTAPIARHHDNSRGRWGAEEGGGVACGAETGVASLCASAVRALGRMGAERTPTHPHRRFCPRAPQFGFLTHALRLEAHWTSQWCTTRAPSSPSSSRKVGARFAGQRVVRRHFWKQWTSLRCDAVVAVMEMLGCSLLLSWGSRCALVGVPHALSVTAAEAVSRTWSFAESLAFFNLIFISRLKMLLVQVFNKLLDWWDDFQSHSDNNHRNKSSWSKAAGHQLLL